MPTYSSLNPPASLADAVAPLAVLPDENFDLIRSIVTSERSFSPDKNQITLLGKAIGLSKDNIEYLFVGLSILYRHVNSGENAELPFDAALHETVDELTDIANWDEEVKRSILERLALLLQKSDIHSVFRKVERLRAGFQPHATGFSSLVELRPRYVDDDSKKLTIDGFVPVIQFRITTDAAKNRHHVFQLTEAAFSEFKSAIDRLQDKIDTLKQVNGSAIKIIEL